MLEKGECRVYVCRRADSEIIIDGHLTEAAWRCAEKLTDFVVPPSNKPAVSQTTAMLLWDDTYLYFGAVMQDEDIYGYHEGHDPPFGFDDMIELFVKPSRVKLPYWEFHFTPRNATRDYFWARRLAVPDEEAMAFDSGLQSAVFVEGTLDNWEDHDKQWTAEAAIPLSAFEETTGMRPESGAQWSFLVARYDYNEYIPGGLELSTAFALPQLNFHWYEAYATLQFE